ncbi:ABC transporter permease [Microbacterium phyllosphaerae]|uniref:ABC transporter permease n=1 Tax=Microbacterium phyllosphaerae TaxID=124798 RepID=UPI0035B617F6
MFAVGAALLVGAAFIVGGEVRSPQDVLLILASMSSAIAICLSAQARSPEIALRRALGASRGSIWRVFTMEGLVIGASAGLAGVALGIGAVVLVCGLHGWGPRCRPLCCSSA